MRPLLELGVDVDVVDMVARWVVRPCNPAGGLCTDVKMDYRNFFSFASRGSFLDEGVMSDRGPQTRVVYNVVSEMDLQMQLRLQL